MKATIFYEVSGIFVDPATKYLQFQGREGHPEAGLFGHNFNLAFIIRWHTRLSADGRSHVVTIYFSKEEQDRDDRLAQERLE